MNRSEFLKRVFLVLGITWLPSRKTAVRPRICLLSFHVRGFQYYHGPGLLARMCAGDPLKLVREPGNRFDEHAIALYYRDQKIGFVPAEKNELLSKLLDNGSTAFRAEILGVDEGAEPWEVLYAGIFWTVEPVH